MDRGRSGMIGAGRPRRVDAAKLVEVNLKEVDERRFASAQRRPWRRRLAL
jgi:hypothetical protein